MATARKLPSGTYRCVVYIGKDDNGKKKYKSFTDPDKRRCEMLAAQFADSHRGYTSSCSFEFAMEQYIASREPVLSPSTVRAYRNIQKVLRSDYRAFCNVSVHEIDARMYQQIINGWTAMLSPKTIRNRTGLISAVMKSKGVLPPPVKLPDKVKPNLHIPDSKDVKSLIATAKDTEMEIPILLAAFAAMRRSEIVALTMDDIDGDVIHVHSAIVMDANGCNVRKHPKTYESDRYIPMPPEIINKIRSKGYITTITNPQHISQRFEHIARKAGCPETRFHDLRHFCASWLHAQGIPEQYILSRGGWTTDGVMKNIYRHALSSEADRINKEVSASISKIFFDE